MNIISMSNFSIVVSALWDHRSINLFLMYRLRPYASRVFSTITH
jgi:hypothetical protein